MRKRHHNQLKKIQTTEKIRVVKMSFKRAFRIGRGQRVHANPEHARVHQIIENLVVEMTKCAKLASLNIHFKFCDALTKTEDEIDAYFSKRADNFFFKQSFRATKLMKLC